MSVISESPDYRLVLDKMELTSPPDTHRLVFRRELLKDGKVESTSLVEMFLTGYDIEKLKSSL
jgi:hypothetical protein